MTNYPKLSKAPIVEAVIEIKVRLTSATDQSYLTTFRQQLAQRFPYDRDLKFFRAFLEVDPDKGPQQALEAGTLGVRLESEDRKWVIQARVDGISVSRLAPYECWESLREQMETVWPIYTKALSPESVVRLGVRYINRVELPSEAIDFDKVLTKGPAIPDKLPQALSEFYSRLVIPDPDEHATLVIVQSLDPPSPGGTLLGIILDIDAFSERAFEINNSEIWNTLDVLRQIKNKAFFNCLTAELVETLK
jgi:uncharacterized protein (TIGR04255 family)